MAFIAGARIHSAGRIWYFDPGNVDVAAGDAALIATPGGTELMTVIIGRREIIPAEGERRLASLVRVATPEDLELAGQWRRRQPEVHEWVLRRLQAAGSPARPSEAAFSWDGSRLVISYIAPELQDLAGIAGELEQLFDARVLLEHAGARDAARQTGDLGLCGRTLCCQTFLTEFPPVSIKMAKNQDLPLNPDKISGACGRLLCCLAYENDMYSATRSRMPRPGSRVTTPDGAGIAGRSHVLRETVEVDLESGERVAVPLADLRRTERNG